MGFVKKYPHDVFLSYAHNDSPGWRLVFERDLLQDLTDRLGSAAQIWRDEHKLRVGHDWSHEIEAAIKGSAVFVSILSPGYQRSEWCKREREIFLGQFASLTDAKVDTKIGELHRFLKIVRMPWENDQHKEFFPQVQHLDFFRRGDLDEELLPGREDFISKVMTTADTIKCLLFAMRRNTASVFVATAGASVHEAEQKLRKELAAQRYEVRPDGPIDRGYTDAGIREQITPALLSVHLLGREVDETSIRQLKLAHALGKPLVVWSAEDSPLEAAATSSLLGGLFGARAGARPPTILSRGVREMIDDVRLLLEREMDEVEPAKAPAAASNVYLLHDSSAPEDTAFARALGADLAKQGMHVLLPSAPSGSSMESHNRFLRDSDGVLLYHKAAPLDWLRYNLPDVVFADRLDKRSRPLRTKAFVLSDPDLVKGLPNVIPTDRFTVDSLGPFLAPLRPGGAA
jgi:TIR domain